MLVGCVFSQQKGKRLGNFTFVQTSVPGIVVIQPTVFEDTRGYFVETYKNDAFTQAGIDGHFVQDNASKSKKGVLRGLHFQRENTQGKLVRVVSGRVFDVGVDVRPGSPYFGCWAGVELSEENKHMLYVPEGFAHGFLVLSDEAEFCYKCTDYYNPAAEGGVRFDDADIGIDWPDIGMPYILSEKDEMLPRLCQQDFSDFERWVPR